MGELLLHYGWWLLALVLLALEVVFSGYFLLWIAVGAAATGLVLWLLPGLSWIGQALSFVVLAFGTCGGYALWRRRHGAGRAEGEVLNRRGEQLLGQQLQLVEPIVNGRGRAQVGDGSWLVSGPELPLGSTVTVTAVQGVLLQVIASDPSAAPRD